MTDYGSPAALLAAVKSRARTVAGDGGPSVDEVQFRFILERFCERVMRSDYWVLKGGNALLARLGNARHTKDVDLTVSESDAEHAMRNLTELAGLDLFDYLRFDLTPASAGTPIRGRTVQCVSVTAYCGTREVRRFSIDIAIGCQPTQPSEFVHHEPVIDLGLPALSQWRVYPLVDHLADKVAASAEPHLVGGSNRFRDLVDLVAIATTQRVGGEQLQNAIASELGRRQITTYTQFTVPPDIDWDRGYAKAAQRAPHVENYRTLAAALALMADFIDPALRGTIAGSRWDPGSRAWSAGATFAP